MKASPFFAVPQTISRRLSPLAVSVVATLAVLALTTVAQAITIVVPPGSSVQAAIDGAVDGDRIELLAGTYDGNLDYSGKNVEIVGVGVDSIVRGDGAGPVVTFASGEGPGAVLDSVMLTGGFSFLGGGVNIVDASPTIVRNFIIDNIATGRGTAIYVAGSSAFPLIANNLMAYNQRLSSGDPHSIQTQDSSPMILNNTIARADSNGIFLSGIGSAVVMNNIIARNGSRGTKDEARRGRGICNFTLSAIITHNNFWKNAKSALLQGGDDYRRIRRAERVIQSPDLIGNSDRSPRFVRRRLAREASLMDVSDFTLRSNSRAIGGGNPDPTYNNLDGSPNTMGHLGGPLAAP